MGFEAWLAPIGAKPSVTVQPADGFNIIYSSGTTGTTKGIVQSYLMRRWHIASNSAGGYADTATMISTPCYSNTMLVRVVPTWGWRALFC